MIFKSKIVIFIFSVVFSIQSCNAQNKNQKWTEDIEYLQKELPNKHIDFYKLIDSTDFVNRTALIKTKIDKLEDYEILFGLQQIIARLGVAHTKLRFPNTKYLSRLPFECEIFNDGIFITNANKNLNGHVGQKIIAINGIPIDTVTQRLSGLISYENDYWLKHELPELIKNPYALDFVNTGKYNESFNIQLDNGKELNVNKRFFPIADNNDIHKPLYLKDTKANYWFEMLNEGILFIQYNKCSEDKNYPFNEFVENILTEMELKKASKIVIDLRHNSGGNSSVIEPLIKSFRNQNIFNSKQVYVCIGKNTFSSGRINALQLCKSGAILIGEPTGGSPISYGWTGHFLLPNSKSRINYSKKHFNLRNCENGYFVNGTNTIKPQILIENYSIDYFNGKDKVLEFIIKLNNNCP